MPLNLIQQTDAVLRSLDALHLAIALCGQRTLATADKALAKVAKQCDINIIFIDARRWVDENQPKTFD